MTPEQLLRLIGELYVNNVVLRAELQSMRSELRRLQAQPSWVKPTHEVPTE